jgi:hypothetical protein
MKIVESRFIQLAIDPDKASIVKIKILLRPTPLLGGDKGVGPLRFKASATKWVGVGYFSTNHS